MPRRPPVSAPPSQAVLTSDRMRQGIRRLERSIGQVEAFDPKIIQTFDETSKADALAASVEAALAQTFGHNTVEHRRYSGAAMFSWPLNMAHPTPIHEIQGNLRRCRTRSLEILHQAVSFLKQELEFNEEDGKSNLANQEQHPKGIGINVVIGHGRSLVWRELKDFIEDRLYLRVDEFNRIAVAGIPTTARLSKMLEEAAFAFLVMTAEDEQIDGTMRARENVVHEAGLFQGKLGFGRAIVLLEEGCEEFSNIRGLGQIRFPKSSISAKFEDVRAVLEREGMIRA